MRGLQTRFRNIRRKPRSQPSSGLTFVPPAKKKKPESRCNHGAEPELGLLDEATYDKHLDQLHRQSSRMTRNKAALTSLMQETATNRRTWIVQNRPPISEIAEKFPLLKEFDWVSVN